MGITQVKVSKDFVGDIIADMRYDNILRIADLNDYDPFTDTYIATIQSKKLPDGDNGLITALKIEYHTFLDYDKKERCFYTLSWKKAD